MSTVNKLPYHLPKQPDEQLRILSNILSIPKSQLGRNVQAEIEAMAVTILYRHLNHIQKQDAMATIRSLNNPILVNSLVTKVVDVIVNPQWGIWSLSNEELLADQDFHAKVDEVAGYIGISASAASGKDFIQNLWKNKKIGKGGWIILAIWGAVIFNKSELNKANREVSNRSQLKTSPLY